jgi:hypothetical protein
MTFARCMLGALALDLLALPEAAAELERALALAREINAPQWTGCATALLARTRIQQGDHERAATLLASVPAPEAPGQTIAQRLLGYARAELALAGGEVVSALRTTDELLAAAPNSGPPPDGAGAIPRLAKLRGDALVAAGRAAEAEAAFCAARERARAYGLRPPTPRSAGSTAPSAAARRLSANMPPPARSSPSWPPGCRTLVCGTSSRRAPPPSCHRRAHPPHSRPPRRPAPA